MTDHKSTDTSERIVKKGKESTETLLNLLVKEAKEYAIFETDPTGIILSWNFGAERMKQFTAEEVIGHNYEMLYRVEDQKDGRPQLNIKLAIEKGRHEEQWWRMKKDGSVFWADAVMTPVYSPDGELISLSKIVRDLTEKKRTEDGLHSAVASAEAASDLKSVFLANMSHEIRTPLGAILGFAEVLKEADCTPEDRLVAADVIDRNGKILLRLIEDILDMSKVEAGKMAIEVSHISLRPLLSEVIDYFESKARDKGLLLKINYGDGVPEKICSDPVRLRQILCNIIGNSVKFTEKGEVTIEVLQTHLPQGKSGVEFVVTDTGAGLTSEERKGLFVAFSRGDSAVTRKFGGTGLGLALSRRLAEKLGGDLSLTEFKVGFGSSFRIRIAHMDADYVKSDEDSKAPDVDAKEKKKSKNIVGAKILVVDDCPDNQTLFKTLLDKWKVISDYADNGIEGVEMAGKGKYDLILMDIQMPLMDGNEATRTLRKSGYTSPIVVVTAHAMNEEKAKSFDAGCDDFLVKPIDKPRLLEILETYAQQ